MIQTSEYVSLGHPDKVADFIVSRILDGYMERDRNVRFGLECQIKDNHVCLGGEISSSFRPTDDAIRDMVREAVRDIGYTHEYAKLWGADNALDADALDIDIHVGRQSPDIAQGVNADGWGDQGIFWGMATGNAKTDFMPEDHALAKSLGLLLYGIAKRGDFGIGLDIKTQVTVDDGKVSGVVVAAPTLRPKANEATEKILNAIQCHLGIDDGADVIINGTGSYVRHASQGDCGTTGRKLAVDFYGGNCRIGGGCPWGKDPTKADVALNIYARNKALALKRGRGLKAVYCAISCCIGRRDISIAYFDGHMTQIFAEKESRPASEVINELGLREKSYAQMCRYGLFTDAVGSV